jgi:hypothetical protein
MFEKEAKERAKDIYIHHFDDDVNYPDVLKAITVGVQKGAEHGYNKANEELEEKISVLLSCKNCPENKDGLICQKEYENKCLAQKIQYIKELKEENAELKEKLKPENCLKLLAKKGYIKFTSDQLTKAKEIIEELYNIIPASMADYAKEPMEHARKFMTEEADK